MTLQTIYQDISAYHHALNCNLDDDLRTRVEGGLQDGYAARKAEIERIANEAHINSALCRTSCQGCDGYHFKACAICPTEQTINAIVLTAQRRILAIGRLDYRGDANRLVGRGDGDSRFDSAQLGRD